MSIGVNSQSTLEQARQLVEAAKKKAEEAKAAAEK